MKGSAKLLIASIIIFACSIGFFAGALCFGCKGMPCMNGNPPCMQKMMPPPGMPGMKGPGMKGPHGDKGPWAHKKGFRHDMMDSILQVTPEQKTALEKHRQQMDSSFKALNGQKMAAEKELREALDNGAAEQIDAAKAKILSAQEALLAARVEGVKNLKTILTEEQQAKFKEFHKNHRHHKKGFGPKDGKGPGPKGPGPIAEPPAAGN